MKSAEELRTAKYKEKRIPVFNPGGGRFSENPKFVKAYRKSALKTGNRNFTEESSERALSPDELKNSVGITIINDRNRPESNVVEHNVYENTSSSEDLVTISTDTKKIKQKEIADSFRAKNSQATSISIEMEKPTMPKSDVRVESNVKRGPVNQHDNNKSKDDDIEQIIRDLYKQ